MTIRREGSAQKVIGSSLDANVIIHCNQETAQFLEGFKDDLQTIFIVSGVEISQDGTGEFNFEEQGLSIDVVKATGEKCERCWMYSDTVGSHPEHPTLCSRCASVVE